MPRQGRPRLTREDLEARVSSYCARYGVVAAEGGLPPFPAGHRESPRHREWLALYKLRERLGRRARGQCDRCSAPVTDGSVFCEEHRGAPASSRRSAGGTRAPASEERRLLSSQGSKCPVCGRRLEADQASADTGPDGGPARALLHPACRDLAARARVAGRDAFERLRAYLWPSD